MRARVKEFDRMNVKFDLLNRKKRLIEISNPFFSCFEQKVVWRNFLALNNLELNSVQNSLEFMFYVIELYAT